MEFSKQKAAIYVTSYLMKELRTQRTQEWKNTSWHRDTHTHTNFNTCIVNRTRGTFHRQHATVCPHLRSRFISYTVFLYITTCLSKADSHKNDTTI